MRALRILENYCRTKPAVLCDGESEAEGRMVDDYRIIHQEPRTIYQSDYGISEANDLNSQRCHSAHAPSQRFPSIKIRSSNPEQSDCLFYAPGELD